MKDIKLNNYGDIDLNLIDGDINTVEDQDELKQYIQNILNINLGELSWNRNFGLDFNSLIASANRESVITEILSNYLKDKLGNLFDSLVINSFSKSEFHTTTLNATVRINNNDGTITDVNTINGY